MIEQKVLAEADFVSTHKNAPTPSGKHCDVSAKKVDKLEIIYELSQQLGQLASGPYSSSARTRNLTQDMNVPE